MGYNATLDNIWIALDDSPSMQAIIVTGRNVTISNSRIRMLAGTPPNAVGIVLENAAYPIIQDSYILLGINGDYTKGLSIENPGGRLTISDTVIQAGCDVWGVDRLGSISGTNVTCDQCNQPSLYCDLICPSSTLCGS